MSAKDRSTYPLAVHLLLYRGGELLFLQRANTGYADGQWSVPAGHVESGESAVAAAVREGAEEVGVAVEPEDLALALVQHKRDPIDGDERVDLFFRTAKFTGEPKNREPHKCAQLQWAAPGELTQVIGYVANALERIEKGAVYAEYGW
ncbi:NUDIX domain-containing protein [Glycomyces sp. NRRL B-16210]|uniref:NUDIX hydrolase n=1 Tax=Glycomyces sp. NRRL B-16210 TaxID=1463821 RepID=UPI0004C1F23F|nr:NUDIX domain-containing protein [Glycomyces sp. NRRL B-16210]